MALYGNRKRASHEVKRLALRHVAELDGEISQMMVIRKALSDFADRCQGDDRPDYPILDELASGGENATVDVSDAGRASPNVGRASRRSRAGQ